MVGEDSPDLRYAGSPSLRLRRKEGGADKNKIGTLPSIPLAEERVDE